MFGLCSQSAELTCHWWPRIISHFLPLSLSCGDQHPLQTPLVLRFPHATTVQVSATGSLLQAPPPTPFFSFLRRPWLNPGSNWEGLGPSGTKTVKPEEETQILVLVSALFSRGVATGFPSLLLTITTDREGSWEGRRWPPESRAEQAHTERHCYESRPRSGRAPLTCDKKNICYQWPLKGPMCKIWLELFIAVIFYFGKSLLYCP